LLDFGPPLTKSNHRAPRLELGGEGWTGPGPGATWGRFWPRTARKPSRTVGSILAFCFWRGSALLVGLRWAAPAGRLAFQRDQPAAAAALDRAEGRGPGCCSQRRAGPATRLRTAARRKGWNEFGRPLSTPRRRYYWTGGQGCGSRRREAELHRAVWPGGRLGRRPAAVWALLRGATCESGGAWAAAPKLMSSWPKRLRSLPLPRPEGAGRTSCGTASGSAATTPTNSPATTADDRNTSTHPPRAKLERAAPIASGQKGDGAQSPGRIASGEATAAPISDLGAAGTAPA